MTIPMADRVAGIEIPDSALARDVTDFIRDAEDDLLFHHSRRVFFFGALQGNRRGLQPDLELLYVGAMFHDLGLDPPLPGVLTTAFRGRQRECGPRLPAPTRRR